MSDVPQSVLARPLLPAAIAIYLTVALSAFEGLAVSAALPQVAGDLGGVALLPWVITVYLLSSGVATIVSGPLVDAFGVRAMFRWSVIVFGIAGFAAGFSTSLEMMVVLRLIQGIGGGFLVAIALAAVALVYPDHLVGRAFAANSVVWGVMGVAGPGIAAAMLTFASWRWIFFINLPLGLLAIAAGWRVLPGPVGESSRKIDVTGAVAVAAITAATLFAVDALDWISLAWLAGVIVVSWWYWGHARSVPNPVVRIAHIAHQPFVGLAMGIGLALAGAFTMYAYIPLYVRAGQGGSTTLTAWSVLFFTVGWTTGASVGSRLLDRRPESSLLLGGVGLVVPSMAVMVAVAALDGPLALVFAGSLGVGFGLGVSTNAALTLLRASTPSAEVGRASAAHQFARNQGFTFGAAIGGAVLLAVVGAQVGDVELVRGLLSGADVEPPPGAAGAVRAGFAISGTVGLTLTVIGFGFVLRTRRWLTPARLAKRSSPSIVE